MVQASDTGGGIITARLQPCPFAQAHRSVSALMSFLKPLVAVLSAAHARGIAHCDLKDTAVMCNASGELILNDWNLSRPVDASLVGRVIGTPLFALTLWKPPSAAAQDSVALAVLIGWVLGLADLGRQVDCFEDAFASSVCLAQEVSELPPKSTWHGKALLFVHLLLVGCDQPLQVTFCAHSVRSAPR